MKMRYENQILETEKNISKFDLLEVEKEFSFTFPNEIKEHYLSFNGGEPEKYMFDGMTIQLFLSIKYGDYTLESSLKNMRDECLISDWLIPFAEDAGGDFYCFSLRKEEEGAIYIWRNDDFDYDHKESAISYVTDSIISFINGMIDEE